MTAVSIPLGPCACAWCSSHPRIVADVQRVIHEANERRDEDDGEIVFLGGAKYRKKVGSK